MDLTTRPDFDVAAEKLVAGLRHLHQSTNPNVHFADLASAIRHRLDAGHEAANLVDQYVNDGVERDKLGHFIECAMTFVIQAARLNDCGSNSALHHLCNAYYVAGMATLQFNLTRGAHLRVQPYEALKEAIVELVATRCPSERWASFEEMWRTIEESVTEANDKLEGMPGFSKNPRAAFDRLRKERADYFLNFLSGPVKRGRPPKKRPST